MAAEALISRKFSFQEYFVWEEKQSERYEFYGGEVFCRVGGTLNHNEIALNVAIFLRNLVRAKGCRVFSENVKLEVIPEEYYAYPDVMLTCDAMDVKAELLVKNPSLLVEVLSPSSEAYDLGGKWQLYQRIKSLQVYMAVRQDKVGVHVYQRSSETQWLYEYFSCAEEKIVLSWLGIEVPLTTIYENISFTPSTFP